MSTPSYIALAQSWHTMISNWQLTTALSFIGSIFSYLIGAENPEILFILLNIFLVDTLLGSVIAIKEGRFSKEGMAKAIYKVVLYGSFMIMFHLARLTIENTYGHVASYIDTGAVMFLLIREAKSINEKLAKASINIPFNPFEKIEQLLNGIGNQNQKKVSDDQK